MKTKLRILLGVAILMVAYFLRPSATGTKDEFSKQQQTSQASPKASKAAKQQVVSNSTTIHFEGLHIDPVMK